MTPPPLESSDAKTTTGTAEALESKSAEPQRPSIQQPPGRQPASPVDALFLERSSPYDFADEPIPRSALESMIEAARWAPSSFNEQPWRFVYAVDSEDRERFMEPLVEFNRDWAKNAAAIVYILAKRTFDKNGKPNRHAAFDAGAAWMSFALQATREGLATHAMGGFDEDQAKKVLGLEGSDPYDVLVAIAVGARGAPSDQPPSDRKPPGVIAHERGFPAS